MSNPKKKPHMGSCTNLINGYWVIPESPIPRRSIPPTEEINNSSLPLSGHPIEIPDIL